MPPLSTTTCPPAGASLFARLCAVFLDLSILAIVDVSSSTSRCRSAGSRWQDVGVLPKGPLIAFLLVQNGGYLVAFTAGGQTLGKMAAGIRVVADERRRARSISGAPSCAR